MFRRNKGGLNLRRFDAYLYIEREFFSVDKITFDKISGLYRNLYGDGAYRYLINVYEKWRIGSVSRTRSTMERILECVPRFLSDEKRFFILKNEVASFMYRIHKEQIKKKIYIDGIDDLYGNYINKIKSFSKKDLPFMVGNRIFTDNEIEGFLEICKYILFEKVKLSYNQVQKDLNLIKHKLSGIRNGTFEAVYKVNFLDYSINISAINSKDYRFKGLDIEEIIPAGRYEKLIINYLHGEFLEISFSENEGKINSLIESGDIDYLIYQYQEIQRQDQDMTFNSEFQCAGGILLLKMESKSINNIKLQLSFSGIKCILYVSLIGVLLFLVLNSGYNKIATLIFGSIVGEIVLISFLMTEIRTLKDLILTLKIHGK